jgi:hypothetical protein
VGKKNNYATLACSFASSEWNRFVLSRRAASQLQAADHPAGRLLPRARRALLAPPAACALLAQLLAARQLFCSRVVLFGRLGTE